MKLRKESWREIVFVCPECGKEFQSESIALHVRLCPQCKRQENAKKVIPLRAMEAAV